MIGDTSHILATTSQTKAEVYTERTKKYFLALFLINTFTCVVTVGYFTSQSTTPVLFIYKYSFPLSWIKYAIVSNTFVLIAYRSWVEKITFMDPMTCSSWSGDCQVLWASGEITLKIDWLLLAMINAAVVLHRIRRHYNFTDLKNLFSLASNQDTRKELLLQHAVPFLAYIVYEVVCIALGFYYIHCE